MCQQSSKLEQQHDPGLWRAGGQGKAGGVGCSRRATPTSRSRQVRRSGRRAAPRRGTWCRRLRCWRPPLAR
eukprot:2200483-Prymnesium_polylepis.1